MADEAVRTQAEKVDLDNLSDSMVAERIEINPDANPMEAPPPPDDGVYRVKLTGGNDWEQAETRPNKTSGESTTYYKTQFRAQIIAEGTKNNNKILFGRENTLTFDGKNVLAYILLQIKGGSKNEQARAFVAGLDTPLKLARAFQQTLAGEPIIKVSSKWRASYKSEVNGETKYLTAKSGQNNFPRNPDGTFQHVITVPNVGDVKANAEIQDYFPDSN